MALRIATLHDCTQVEFGLEGNDPIGAHLRCDDKIFRIQAGFPLQARPAAYGAARLLETSHRHVLIVQTADRYLVGLELPNDRLSMGSIVMP
jgi:hypothetical protein